MDRSRRKACIGFGEVKPWSQFELGKEAMQTKGMASISHGFKATLLMLLLAVGPVVFAQTLVPCANFGDNPGNLNMYYYCPSGLNGASPLVIVLHGCQQTPGDIARESGWLTLADRNGFRLLFPEQRVQNNSSFCFNWFLNEDNSYNSGELKSLWSMTNYMQTQFSVLPEKIFIVGISAGASMAIAFGACYPDLVSGVGSIAGLPYKAANTPQEAYLAMSGNINKTAQEWNTLVRQQRMDYTGNYPKLFTVQGSSDAVVAPINQSEMVEQWNGLYETPSNQIITMSPAESLSFLSRNDYWVANQTVNIRKYYLSGLGHFWPLDTATCNQSCGQEGSFSYHVGWNVTFRMAEYFGLLDTNQYLNIQPVGQFQYYGSPSNATQWNWGISSGGQLVGNTDQLSVTAYGANPTSYLSLNAKDASGCSYYPAYYLMPSPLNGFTSYASPRIIVKINHSGFSWEWERLESKEFWLLDLQGKTIFYRKESPETLQGNIPCSGWKPGLYLLQYRLGSGEFGSQKLLWLAN